MQRSERRALLSLLGLAVLGHAVRLVADRPGEPPGQVRLLASLPGTSPLAHRDSTMALGRPLGPGERIDVDRAGVLEIARLPRIGVALAKRIVADRDTRGPFGSLAGLDRVPGVGPGLLRQIEPHVTFSTGPAVAGTTTGVGAGGPAPPAAPRSRGPSAPLSLNSATAAQLDSLPGIGRARAAAIVRDRERRGPFPSVESLARVPGINPALVARLRDRLQVP